MKIFLLIFKPLRDNLIVQWRDSCSDSKLQSGDQQRRRVLLYRMTSDPWDSSGQVLSLAALSVKPANQNARTEFLPCDRLCRHLITARRLWVRLTDRHHPKSWRGECGKLIDDLNAWIKKVDEVKWTKLVKSWRTKVQQVKTPNRKWEVLLWGN